MSSCWWSDHMEWWDNITNQMKHLPHYFLFHLQPLGNFCKMEGRGMEIGFLICWGTRILTPESVIKFIIQECHKAESGCRGHDSEICSKTIVFAQISSWKRGSSDDSGHHSIVYTGVWSGRHHQLHCSITNPRQDQWQCQQTTTPSMLVNWVPHSRWV